MEPELVARRHRAFIESRAFSKLASFDSEAASWKDWSFKFENMAAAVVPSSRESLERAAQQETPIFTDVEAGPDSVEFNPGRRDTDTRRRFGSLAETREKV